MSKRSVDPAEQSEGNERSESGGRTRTNPILVLWPESGIEV